MKASSDNTLPGGYRVVPLEENSSFSPLSLCLVVQDGSQESAGRGGLILLRDLPDADVYLGALADWDQGIHELVEIWVQRVNGFGAQLASPRELGSNRELDQRWSNRFQAMCRLGTGDVYVTGWEEHHPDPVFLDAALAETRLLENGTTGTWRLCQDDEMLKSCGLPEYGGSLHRYLSNGLAGEQARFIPVTTGAPENHQTLSPADAFQDLVPVNREGGLLMVRKFYPMHLEEFADVVGGAAWRGVERLGGAFKPKGVYGELADAYDLRHRGRGMLLGHLGVEGQLLETLHLKARLLLDLFLLVRGYVEGTQEPILNLSPHHFGAQIAEVSSGLPFLWAYKVGLREPGEAFASIIERTAGERVFLPAAHPRESVYRSGELSLVIAGEGVVRIRKVIAEEGKIPVVLEGTLDTDEAVRPARKDLLQLRLNSGSTRLDVHGQFVPSAASVHGEYRFRTFPRQIDPGILKSMQSEEGLSIFPSTPFTVVPLLGPACDLFSLGVLAIRILLIDGDHSLPVVLDEVLSLASLLGQNTEEGGSVGERLQRVISENNPEHWMVLLGPHRLVQHEIQPEVARMYVPNELWWDLIALVLSLFPGRGADSFCADLSDFNAGALEKTFEEPIRVLEAICGRTQSLVTGDVVRNREVASEIQKIIRELGREEP